MKLLGRWKGKWMNRFRLVRSLPVLEQRLKDHEGRIQELERELDLGQEPSEFGNPLQRRRQMELLRDTPLSEDEERKWAAGV